MKYYIIFGPPGAGKGTQSVLLAEKFNLKHISTGELLRNELEQKTELGLYAKSIMESGQLVDDETVIAIIKKAVNISEGEVTGFIFDGFPRTLDQAVALDKLLETLGKKIDAVIFLEIEEELMITRIQRRALIEDRKDDADIATIRNRIATYHKKTEPLIAYYKGRGKYFPVRGDSGIEENFLELCKIINQVHNE